jgi:hypothetical protein
VQCLHAQTNAGSKAAKPIISAMKTAVAIAFVCILGALASAGFFLMRGSGDDAAKSRNMFRALALRIGLSVAVFLFILLAWQLGWIQPSGIAAGA